MWNINRLGHKWEEGCILIIPFSLRQIFILKGDIKGACVLGVQRAALSVVNSITLEI